MLYLLKQLLLGLLGIGYKKGRIILAPGCPKTIRIKTRFTPRSVSLRFKDAAMPPVCIGEVDSFDVAIIPHGFVLIVSIKSRARDIGWTAIGRW